MGKISFNPRLVQQELEAIASVVEVDAQRLAQMLPPAGVGMQHEPIRLCGACYAESPCHRMNGSTSRCEVRSPSTQDFSKVSKTVKHLLKCLRCGRMGAVTDVGCRLQKWQSYRRFDDKTRKRCEIN